MDAVGRVSGIVAQGVTFQQSSTTATGVGTGLVSVVGTGGQALGASRQAWSSASQSQGVAVTALAALLANSSRGINAYNRSLMPPVPAGGAHNALTADRTEDWARWFAELMFRNSLVSRGFDDRMERLYYCSRCAAIYVPGEGDFALLADAAPVLYRYPTYAGDEFCEIEGGLWGKVGGFFSTHCHHAFFAMAFGPKSIEYVHELLWIERRPLLTPAMDPENPTGRVLENYNYELVLIPIPKSNSNQTMTNYRQMVADLEAKGWGKQNEQGPYWWQARFMRRPKE